MEDPPVYIYDGCVSSKANMVLLKVYHSIIHYVHSCYYVWEPVQKEMPPKDALG